MADEASIRNRLVALASSRRTRRADFVAELPSRWQPTQITDPRSRLPFTEQGAWEYVVAALESGCPIQEIDLKVPPGKKAYVLLLESANQTPIYVKLQVCGDHVRGRSFHYSEPGR